MSQFEPYSINPFIQLCILRLKVRLVQGVVDAARLREQVTGLTKAQNGVPWPGALFCPETCVKPKKWAWEGNSAMKKAIRGSQRYWR